MGDVFDAVTQYGLPLVMFIGVIWLSVSNVVVWRPSHDAICRLYEQQIADLRAERDRFADIARPAVESAKETAQLVRTVRSK